MSSPNCEKKCGWHYEVETDQFDKVRGVCKGDIWDEEWLFCPYCGEKAE